MKNRRDKLRKIHFENEEWKYLISYSNVRIFSPNKEVTEVPRKEVSNDLIYSSYLNEDVYLITPSHVKKYIEVNLRNK